MSSRHAVPYALLATILGGPTFADTGCAAFQGEWWWFTGYIVSITADHRITYEGKTVGHWSCANSTKNTAKLFWDTKFTDTLTVSGDRITGINDAGTKIWANRSSPGTPADEPHPQAPMQPTAPTAGQSEQRAGSGCQAGIAASWRVRCQQELRKTQGPSPSQSAINSCVLDKMAACGNLVP